MLIISILLLFYLTNIPIKTYQFIKKNVLTIRYITCRKRGIVAICRSRKIVSSDDQITWFCRCKVIEPQLYEKDIISMSLT